MSAAARHCRGRGLSDQADPVDRAVSAGRPERHHRAREGGLDFVFDTCPARTCSRWETYPRQRPTSSSVRGLMVVQHVAPAKAKRSSHAKRSASRSCCQNLRHRMRSRKAASASRISATWLRRTFTFVLPVRSRPPLHERGKWIGPAPLLDQCVPHLRAEGSVHEGTATSHQAVGGRVCCRCCAGAPGQKSGCNAYSSRDG